jgi:hypothetical protein
MAENLSYLCVTYLEDEHGGQELLLVQFTERRHGQIELITAPVGNAGLDRIIAAVPLPVSACMYVCLKRLVDGWLDACMYGWMV